MDGQKKNPHFNFKCAPHKHNLPILTLLRYVNCKESEGREQCESLVARTGPHPGKHQHQKRALCKWLCFWCDLVTQKLREDSYIQKWGSSKKKSWEAETGKVISLASQTGEEI